MSITGNMFSMTEVQKNVWIETLRPIDACVCAAAESYLLRNTCNEELNDPSNYLFMPEPSKHKGCLTALLNAISSLGCRLNGLRSCFLNTPCKAILRGGLCECFSLIIKTADVKFEMSWHTNLEGHLVLGRSPLFRTKRILDKLSVISVWIPDFTYKSNLIYMQ